MAQALRNGRNHLAGRHSARQAAQVGRLELSLGPQGHFDRLFMVGDGAAGIVDG